LRAGKQTAIEEIQAAGFQLQKGLFEREFPYKNHQSELTPNKKTRHTGSLPQ
jgi:hypothetical protein